ncbi:hypothetical protein ACPA0F_18530 [Solibacillus silvestris]
MRLKLFTIFLCSLLLLSGCGDKAKASVNLTDASDEVFENVDLFIKDIYLSYNGEELSEDNKKVRRWVYDKYNSDSLDSMEDKILVALSVALDTTVQAYSISKKYSNSELETAEFKDTIEEYFKDAENEYGINYANK